MHKVAQVLASLNRGGIETWLKDVVANYDREKMQLDFILTQGEYGAYGDFIEGKGSRLHTIPLHKGVIFFSVRLYKKLRKEKYEVVHTHLNFFSGYICLIARIAGVKTIISHSHNDNRAEQADCSWIRKSYFRLQRFLINTFSTQRVACSGEAGVSLYGTRQFLTIYCGVDFAGKFAGTENTGENFFRENNISPDAYVIGHVGAFIEQKNHKLVIDIFDSIVRKNSNAYLVLVGQGGLEDEIRRMVDLRGIPNVIFAGGRDDVPRLMKQVFDVLLFPSLHEGLPIVLLEAQAAGLPCVISDRISQEAIVLKDIISVVPLDEKVETWRDTVLRMKGAAVNKEKCLSEMVSSDFDISKSVRNLESIYTGL